MKKQEEESAEEKLKEFFEIDDYDEIVLNKGLSQRIILVAANFRKVVTSTVMWLMNYNLKIQCFKVTPYQLEDQVIINFEQIIPIKDAEEYVISMATKNQEDLSQQDLSKARYVTRINF